MQTTNNDTKLFTAREAAKQLAISEKTLWSITSPRGPLTCVRIGRSVRYSPADLRSYIDLSDRPTLPSKTAPSVNGAVWAGLLEQPGLPILGERVRFSSGPFTISHFVRTM